MVDEIHQTANSQSSSAPDNSVSDDSVSEVIEELHEEDATLDIDFDGTADGSGVTAANHNPESQGAVNTDSKAVAGESGDVVAELERQLSDLRAQLEERTNQSMRIAADFENYRKRTSKEKEELEGQIKGNTIVELLPVVDNFERARSQIKPQTEAEMTIHKSYQSVYKQLVESLKRLGVSAMRAEGQEFNPLLHEAVMREPTPDHEEGTIIEEFVRGYQLGERVLRHAMVKVAATPEDNAPGQNMES